METNFFRLSFKCACSIKENLYCFQLFPCLKMTWEPHENYTSEHCHPHGRSANNAAVSQHFFKGKGERSHNNNIYLKENKKGMDKKVKKNESDDNFVQGPVPQKPRKRFGSEKQLRN